MPAPSPALLTLAVTAGLAMAGAARAADAPASPPPPVAFTLTAAADVVGAVAGDAPRRGRELDLTDFGLDADLQPLVGWQGAKARLWGELTGGGQPNADIGTLQGVDNIEVGRQTARLYEAWLDQGFMDGAASLRAGLYNLNSEFYATDSSSLLIAPTYGIGSTLAATGVSGPSIYPSTALSLRLRLAAQDGRYVQAAVIDAKAGDPGDLGGVDTRFSSGVLMIAQGGVANDQGSLSLGAWGYSDRMDDLFDTDSLGDPRQRRAAGAYAMAELARGPVTWFLRGGVSDGRTSPFRTSWQGGLLLSPALPGRPDSKFSAGLDLDGLGDAYRRAAAAGGQRLDAYEAVLELTYADSLGPHLALQPDLQLIRHPGGDPARNLITVLGVRLRYEY